MLIPFITEIQINIGVLVVLAMTAALVPDLDATESKIKHVELWELKPLVLLAILLNRRFGHRGVLHSLRGWAVWVVLLMPLSLWISWASVATLSAGYASHLVADACTKTGIPLLHPQRYRFHLLPKSLLLSTGSDFEGAYFVVFAVLTIMLLIAGLG